jgi:hypothetical protein
MIFKARIITIFFIKITFSTYENLEAAGETQRPEIN